MDKFNPVRNILTPVSDFKTAIKNKVPVKWSNIWCNISPANKLCLIKNDTSLWRTSFHKNSKEEVLLSSLRIGHSRMTYSYLLSREPPPNWNLCGT